MISGVRCKITFIFIRLLKSLGIECDFNIIENRNFKFTKIKNCDLNKRKDFSVEIDNR